MKKPSGKITPSNYSKGFPKALAEICDLLKKEIDGALAGAESKIYYSMPVWFIDDNPVVGYKAASGHVLLLFWSGQSFGEKGLQAAGKYKAAEIRYRKAGEIDLPSLKRWLEKSKKNIWDYKNIAKNGGLKPVK